MNRTATQKTAALTRALLADMMDELMRKGCDKDHSLIVRASQLDAMLAEDEAPVASPRETAAVPAAPPKLHQLTAEEINRLDLSDVDALDLPPIHGRIWPRRPSPLKTG